MANEIQRWTFPNTLTAGDIVDFTFDGVTETLTVVSATHADLDSFFDTLIGSGNWQSVGDWSSGTTRDIEFIGTYADTNINQSITGLIVGDALYNTPVNEVQRWTFSGSIVAPIDAVNEIQILHLNDATTGIITLSTPGPGVQITVDSADSTTIQAEFDYYLGSGKVNVTGVAPDFNIEFIGTYAGQPIDEMTISSNTTDGTPTITTDTEGVSAQAGSTSTFSWNGNTATYHFYTQGVADFAEELFGVGNVSVTSPAGATYDFELIGDLAGANQPLATAAPDNYVGTSNVVTITNGSPTTVRGSCSITTIQNGSPPGNIYDEYGSGGLIVSGITNINAIYNCVILSNIISSGTGVANAIYNHMGLSSVATYGIGIVNAIYSVSGISNVVISGISSITVASPQTYNDTSVGGAKCSGTSVVLIKINKKRSKICVKLGKINSEKYWDLVYPEKSNFYQGNTEPAYLPAMTRCLQNL